MMTKAKRCPTPNACDDLEERGASYSLGALSAAALQAIEIWAASVQRKPRAMDLASTTSVEPNEAHSSSSSMFSLFQVATGDSWAGGVVRPVLKHDPNLVLFFIGFVCI